MTHSFGNLEAGLQSWRLATNHNRMMELQEAALSPKEGPVELAYFGSSAWRPPETVVFSVWRRFSCDWIVARRRKG